MDQDCSQCFDAELLAAWLSGGLEPTQLRAAEAHLTECADCRGVLADAAAALHPPESVGPPSQSRTWDAGPVPGTVIAGKYRLEELIGQGAMGLVFAAQQRPGPRVAIKVLHSQEPSAAARLIREAQTCARLDHEHIVRVFDAGQLPSGAPYLVMELLVGETLEQRLARDPLPLALALSHVREACAGLAVAHAAGVIHRDLKPSNLFLAGPADAPRVKLLDFGLSKKIGPAKLGSSLTLPRTVLGSPAYMSPEQSRAQPLDERTDIWSIGVILYELLTGRRPFVADTLPGLLLAIATVTPDRPSTLVAGLPSGLDELVLGCLEKTSARRISSVKDLVVSLDWMRARVPNRVAFRRPPPSDE